MSDGMIGGGDNPRATVPDYIEPIVGYRTWRVSEGRLVSPYISECVWDSPEKGAECLNFHGGKSRYADNPGHVPPVAACQCGLYAYYHVPRIPANSATPYVVGAVTAVGKIAAHLTGMRAERLKIVALAASDPLTRSLAADLGVPCVPWDELPEFAVEFGKPMDPAVLKRVRERNEAIQAEYARRREEREAHNRKIARRKRRVRRVLGLGTQIFSRGARRDGE